MFDFKGLQFIKYEYENGNLAIAIQGEENEIGFFDEIVSVNLVNCFTPKGYAYIDTNNFPFAEELIKENGIGENTGIKGYSGWCEYPLYKINEDKLKEGE